MSYIINNTNPFVSIKLTEIGREKLASGSLNFSFWAIGDSEINYEREARYDNQLGDNLNVTAPSRILRPKDRQPNFKYFITTNGTTNLNTLQLANIDVIKAVVNNEAEVRGFFNETGSTFTTLSSSTYVVSSRLINNSSLTGGTDLFITGLTYTVGDLILIKVGNCLATGQTQYANTLALPNLWFKIQLSAATNTIRVDRLLPNLSGDCGTSQVIVYPSGEVWDTYNSETVPYWDSGTLSFDSCCGVSCTDVPIWNMNSVWCEDPAGFSGGTLFNDYEHYWDFGSYDYLGQKYPYLWYDCQEDASLSNAICEVAGLSVIDPIKKSIAIIHYTNNTVSNVYGEFFYIDTTNNKNLILDIPDLMYHRRSFSTATGNIMGMRFIASGATQLIPNSEIEYIPLIEQPTFVNGTPLIVGKVFPQLKLVVIDDDEIVMAMSYKSNRNWTLPPLSATLVSPQVGSSGVLPTDSTMYITYILDNKLSGVTTTGITTPINCQYYTKITNTTPTIKDINFKMSQLDLLPYMRKVEDINYDGLGFYARNLKVLWQVVSNSNDRPLTQDWNEFDFTSTSLTTNVGETIDPLALENQNPLANGFLIDTAVSTGSTQFSIVNTLTLPLNTEPNKLQFGDERFFYGNLNTYIGASIYKTVFRLNVNSTFNVTSNPTRTLASNEPNIRVSEVGIYDSNNNLVVVGKLSKAVEIQNGGNITLELSIDF
jgi:RNAse (barnase) inhibitor barstar